MNLKVKFKKSYGIALIVLVVTIVLLILAGVSISMLTGQNGILKAYTNGYADASYMEIDKFTGELF